MKGTGVFATEEEVAELMELKKKAETTPAILLFGKHDLSGDAWRRVRERCHEMAMAHGLPEIPGFYGLNEEHEFVTAEEG